MSNFQKMLNLRRLMSFNKTACKGYSTSEHKHSSNGTEIATEAHPSTPCWSELALTSEYTQYWLPTHT